MIRLIWIGLIVILHSICGGYQSYAQDEIEFDYPLDSLNEVITQSGVQIDSEISTDNQGSLYINTSEPKTIELIELNKEDFKNKRLTFKAQMRSQDLQATDDMRGISYIELAAKFPNGEELVSRGPRIPINGTTDWRPVDTVLYIDKNELPESIKLNLVVEGVGEVWIDSAELEAIPLRLNYLFWGHIVVWVVLIIYIYNLYRKNRQLKRELEII